MANLQKHIVHLVIVAYMKEECEEKKSNTQGLSHNPMHRTLVGI